MIYVTNQQEIVAHAKYCMTNKATIVNNIPKDKNVYDRSMRSFALVDNALSASQTDIGESSNIAQICLSYTYTFDDQKYEDAICVLSVVCQCAIDSAKRRFCIDTTDEIKRIKKLVNVKGNGYPLFWLNIRRGFNKKLVNPKIKCPMNKLYGYGLPRLQGKPRTLPFSDFFIPHKAPADRNMAKRVEEFIQKYSIKLNEYNSSDENSYDEYLLLRADYDDMIEDIRRISLSRNAVGLVSWLINRAFMVTPNINKNRDIINTRLHKNRSLLLKVLYDVNPKIFMMCFKSSK